MLIASLVLVVNIENADIIDHNRVQLCGIASCGYNQLQPSPSPLTNLKPTIMIMMSRCEAFNKVMRNYNIHSNRMASSRDIATKFAQLEQLRLLCSCQTTYE